MENKELQLPTDLDAEQEEVEVIGINTLCRLCASQNERLIGIFSEEGISNDLSNKINLYLPIKVASTDELPLQCCWNCASTLLAWHELVLTSVEIDRKFRNSQFIPEKEIEEDGEFDNSANGCSDDNDDCDNEEGKDNNEKTQLSETEKEDSKSEKSQASETEKQDSDSDTSDLIILDCIPDEDINTTEIINMLPRYKSVIREACVIDKDTEPKVKLNFLTDVRNESEVKQWISELENNTKTSYSVDSAPKSAGKFVEFKRRLRCQRNTRCDRLYEAGLKKRTRNTNCPSRIIITIRLIRANKRFRGKNKENLRAKYAQMREMPCEMTYIVTHNHETTTTDALRLRKMCPQVKEKLIELFKGGHSVTSAMDTLKLEIQKTHENYEEVLADARYFPSYQACYYLYMHDFKKQYGPLDFNMDAKKILMEKLTEYNKEIGNENCAKAIFDETDYVICLCPPLFMRVHQYIRASSEMVFMYSTGAVGNDGSRVFILLTHSECGGLPLAILITSSESTNLINSGFELLKEMIGDQIFGGNTDGPDIFIIDDSSAEQAAIKNAWPKSKCFLCIFHILQSVWKWLIKSKNGLSLEKQIEFFQQFKRISYATTHEDCLEQYTIAIDASAECPGYKEILEQYWERRELWALVYRTNIQLTSDHTYNSSNNYSEVFTKIKMERILERTRALNAVQMVDFILSELVDYYERRLLDAAHNGQCNNLTRRIQSAPKGLRERIITLSDNLLLIPSEKEDNHVYLVNMDVLVCGCFNGKSGKGCKHIDRASLAIPQPKTQTVCNLATRELFQLIATGVNTPSHQEQPSIEIEITEERQENITSDLGENILLKMNEICKSFLQTWPTEATVGLNKIYETLLMIETASMFASQCTTFGCEINEASNEISFDGLMTDDSAGRDILKKINDVCRSFVQESPMEAITGLTKLCETLEKIRDPSVFTSCCINFRLGINRKKRVKPSEISPTLSLGGKRIHLDDSLKSRNIIKGRMKRVQSSQY